MMPWCLIITEYEDDKLGLWCELLSFMIRSFNLAMIRFCPDLLSRFITLNWMNADECRLETDFVIIWQLNIRICKGQHCLLADSGFNPELLLSVWSVSYGQGFLRVRRFPPSSGRSICGAELLHMWVGLMCVCVFIHTSRVYSHFMHSIPRIGTGPTELELSQPYTFKNVCVCCCVTH